MALISVRHLGAMEMKGIIDGLFYFFCYLTERIGGAKISLLAREF
jgi:hypothetical protein